MIPCDPAIQVPFPDGHVVPWWVDRERARQEFSKISAKDAARFVQVDDQLKKLARYLQPFFMEPPPEIDTSTMKGWADLFRVGKRFRGISSAEISQLVSFLTGSLGEFLDHNYESEKMKTMFLANNVYGKHGGPYQPGTAIGLLFHLLSGGEHELQGFYGHVMGGMGSITQALAAAGKKLGRGDSHFGAGGAHRGARGPGAQRCSGRRNGVSRADDSFQRRSEADVSGNGGREGTAGGFSVRRARHQDAGTVREGEFGAVGRAAIHRDLAARRRRWSARSIRWFRRWHLRSAAMTSPSLARFRKSCGWIAWCRRMRIDSLAPPGKHILTCFVQYVPYHLREGHWDEKRELLGDRVVRKIAEYAPNVPGAIVARQVLTPLDLERTYGLTEGNIFHGDLRLEQLFFMRPVPGWSQYRTPIDGLYLCGAGAHPGGGVTGAPGRNAAHQALRDWKKGRLREAAA